MAKARHYIEFANQKRMRSSSLKKALDLLEKKPDTFPAIKIGQDVARINGQWHVLTSTLDQKLWE